MSNKESKITASKSKNPFLGLALISFGVIGLLYFGGKLFFTYNTTQNTPAQTHTVYTVSLASAAAPTARPSGDAALEASIRQGKLALVHGIEGKHLVALPKKFSTKAERIHSETYQALIDMMTAAKSDGVDLSVVSGFRSYERQKYIWENKWGDAAQDDTKKAAEILQWSSFPGVSRHHWGTDVDFNSVNPAYWQLKEGEKVYHWLQENAYKYGFCQVYGAGRSKGYSEEKWHWSHIPIANRYYHLMAQPAILQIALNQKVRGAKAVRDLGTAMDYVVGINSCSVNMYAPKMQGKTQA